MSILSYSHGLVDAANIDNEHPQLVPLPRRIADELTVLSVLGILAVADIGAVFETKVFSTDASDSKGAITSAQVPEQIAQMLWRGCKSKGAYSRLKSPYEVLLDKLGLREEGDENERSFQDCSSYRPAPQKALAFHYDFIEVFAGSAKVSSAASSWVLWLALP